MFHATPATGRARGSITAIFFINGILIGCWASSIPQIKERLALDEGTLGLALLFFAFGSIVAMLFGGPRIDSFGSRLVLLFSTLGFSMSLPLVLLAGSLPQLLAIVVVIGFANGLMDVSMNAQGITVERQRGRPIMSSLHAFFSIGGMAGAAAAALTYGLGGELSHYLIGICCVVIPPAIFALQGLFADAQPAAAIRRRILALPPRPLWLIAAFTFVAFVCEGAMFDWSAVYLRDALGRDAATAAMGFGVFSAAMAAGRLLGDRMVARSSRVVILRGSAILACCGYALALSGESTTLTFLGYALIGLGVANIVPVLFSLAGSQEGIGPGSGIAAVATVGYSGSLLGPAWVGFLADLSSLRLSLAVTAVFLLLLVIFCGRLRHR
ncbi:MFS transporter [Pelagibius litoralis]|uniref:MFS transporter n=1 Tax=Pelagibius litoralis TaxID=374515 RepID=A0A967EV93_9PROT|nr:MFS transporter [Pelagibius litoralis]NIA67504.1 MFS transporter [Pelagibius litoralis]